jgi:hypothetical protein
MSGHTSLDRMSSLQKIVLVISVALVGIGSSGMILSFMYMSSVELSDITAGVSGFISGAIFVAGGLISAAVVSTTHRE